VLLIAVMRTGMAVGVTYALWGASGTAITASLAAVLFDERFTWPMVTGICLIIVGVLFVELGSRGEHGAA
jgi:small multidrug resistance pump